MNEDIEHVRRMLAPANPSPRGRLAGSSRDAIGQADYVRVAADADSGRSHRATRGRVRGRRITWFAGGLGLTAAAVAAAMALTSGAATPVGDRGASPVAVPQSPQRILLAAADVAERTPAGSGTYWYLKLTERQSASSAPEQSEEWVRRDGQTWSRGAKSKGKVRMRHGPTPWHLGGAELSFKQLQTLPTEPRALKAWIADAIKRSDVRTSAGRPTPADLKEFTFQGLVSLICTLPAPPKVRAAAFRSIASYPNVKSLGAVEGGQGLEIAQGEGQAARLIVDPATGLVRKSNFFVTRDGAQYFVPGTGSVTFTTAWTSHLPK